MSLKNLSVKTKVHKNLRNKLNNKRINLIYKRFEKSLNIKENFVVAVSGGGDSLSLAFLAKIYSLKNRLKPKFFIVVSQDQNPVEPEPSNEVLHRVPGLELLLETDYRLIETIERFEIYQLNTH